MHIKLILPLGLLAIVSTMQTNAQAESPQPAALRERIAKIEQNIQQVTASVLEAAQKLAEHERAIKNKKLISEENRLKMVGVEEEGNRLAKRLAILNEELKDTKGQLLEGV